MHEPLPLYSDMKFQLPFELPGEGKMPQTVLLDRQGRIRASFSGEADWAGPEARALVDALLGRSEFLTPYTPYQPECAQAPTNPGQPAKAPRQQAL